MVTGLRRNGVRQLLMQSYPLRIPRYEHPIRLRISFIAITCLVMVTLAFLGFTNFSHALPINDKVLHAVCFGIATVTVYFILDVEEDARRIWFWRNANVIFTAFLCLFCGGILSEFVQSMLPYKTFQWGDVFANLFGSSIGLVVAFHAEKYYRYRREIARLYRPLSTDGTYTFPGLEDDEEELLPTHHTNYPNKQDTKKKGPAALADVWSEREELFGIGDDDDEAGPAPHTPITSVPKITITQYPSPTTES